MGYLNNIFVNVKILTAPFSGHGCTI